MKTMMGYSFFAMLVALSLTLAWGGFGVADAATSPALKAAGESAGAGHNAEGIKHYKAEHWKVAAEHFQEAITADAKLAEAHYNLALCLDKMGNHKEATQSFKKSLDLAPDNPAIADSGILKAHLGMK
jgi:Flp pilus assembly protein TadD